MRLGQPQLPSLGDVLPNLYVPFEARRLSCPRVLWLNLGYMIELGVDIESPSERNRFSEKLLERFAYSVPDQCDPEGKYCSETQVFYADRYGGPIGTIHGGSGRCGASGDFHAKGIGRTPLVAAEADWYHSHGCMWLEEAIRETIYSQIARAEFPHSAVPVVAIIDCGLNIYYGENEPPGARRAIIVRPNFIRLSHLERSIYFGTAGSTTSDQYRDALRTKEVIQFFADRTSRGDNNLICTRNIEDTFSRIGRQIGFGWASRLFHGGYLSSNITVNGELLDFGSFRALPNWRKAYTAPNQPAFGDDVQMILASAHSIAFYMSRYTQGKSPSSPPSSLRKQLQATTQRSAANQFECEIASLIAPIAVQSEILARSVRESLVELFAEQQSYPVSYLLGERTGGIPWVTNTRPKEFRSTSPGRSEPLERLDRLMMKIEKSSDSGSLVRQNFMRSLRPRRLLFREQLLDLTERLLAGQSYNAADFPIRLHRYIDRVVSAGRRTWRVANPQHLVMAHYSDGLCSVLNCINVQERSSYRRIEAVASEERIFLPGGPVPRGEVEARTTLREIGNCRITYDTFGSE